MIELTSKERKALEKVAHDLEPMVIVGGNGVTPTLEQKVLECLKAHQLIKVKFNEFKDEKKELSYQIAERTDSTVVRIIGNVAIFYRPKDEEEN